MQFLFLIVNKNAGSTVSLVFVTPVVYIKNFEFKLHEMSCNLLYYFLKKVHSVISFLYHAIQIPFTVKMLSFVSKCLQNGASVEYYLKLYKYGCINELIIQ